MRIGALFHAKARDRMPESYVVLALAKVWREEGHEFELIHGPDRERIAACDIVFNHVDLTRVPSEYDVAGPVVINGGERSVAKSRVSDLGVSANEGWDGPVIVKTEWNHGGLPENSTRRTRRWTRWRRRLVERGWLGLGYCDMINPHRYPIFEAIDRVPRGVWKNPNLVVEKFLPERDGDLYVLRNIYFLGDRVHCHRMLSRKPNVRTITSERIEPIPVPDDVASLIARSGLEYGKIDYVVHDGRSWLIDATRTPCLSRPEDERMAIARTIAPGLHDFLEAAAVEER